MYQVGASQTEQNIRLVIIYGIYAKSKKLYKLQISIKKKNDVNINLF